MFIPILGNSQTIRKKIAKKGNIFINKTIVDGGEPIYFLMGQNSEYSRIIDIVSPLYGKKEDVISFFEGAIKLYNTYKGENVSDEINNVEVSLSKVLGSTVIFVQDKKSNGYLTMKKKDLDFFLSKMKEEWKYNKLYMHFLSTAYLNSL